MDLSLDLFQTSSDMEILRAKTENLSFENLSCLVTSPDLLSHLQDLKRDGGRKTSSFQWLGPHLLTFLKYAIKLFQCLKFPDHRLRIWYEELLDTLRRLDDSASDCILYKNFFTHLDNKHYKNFLEISPSFVPVLKMFFTIEAHMFDNCARIDISWEIFIDFIFETIGEMLKCRTDSSILVSNQLKFLEKGLKFLIVFLIHSLSRYNLCWEGLDKNIYTEIEAVFNEARLFLHSFFFTTDLVTVTKMDLAIFALLEKIEIVQVKIKYNWLAVSAKIRSPQVAESLSEISSSQDKSPQDAEGTIVGLGDTTTQITSKLVGGPDYRQIISIVGMGGLGKTTLAKKIYNDSYVRYYFDELSWCVISQTYNKRKLLIDILSSLKRNPNRDIISKMEDENLADRLHKSLKGIRYLIVMDDLWDKEAWNDLRRLFPDDTNGSRILLTSRLKNLALEISHVIIEPPPLSPDESWNLLEQKMFKTERCPQKLQEIGKQIAANCKGLPLLVVLIAGVILNMEKKESVWQEVAESLSSYISQRADNYIPTLELSYKHLPDPLKPCFLYLSAFEEDEEISVKKLLLLWIAEGFIDKKEHKTLEDVAEEYLMELVDRSLLQVSKRRSDNRVRTCTVHDVVLHMCNKLVVEDEKFLFQHRFLVSMYLRRLSMGWSHHVLTPRNLSEAFSTFYSSEKIRILDSDSDSEYYVSVHLGLKIMPDLRYLEFPEFQITEEKPSILSKLHNLEYLSLHEEFELPTCLLNMPKLRHLRVFGSPYVEGVRFSKNCDSSRINCLQTLGLVNISDSEDEKILRCSPNLRRLKCSSTGNHFPDLNFLSQLQSLKMYGSVSFGGDYSLVKFPENIKKLAYSGPRLPYDKMSLIGKLPNLEILKLGVRFEGKIWDTNDDEFQKLKFLRLQFQELEHWSSSRDHFPVLERLELAYCNHLKMIPFEFSMISTLREIDVHYCSKNTGSSALEIRQVQRDYGNEEFDVTIFPSMVS